MLVSLVSNSKPLTPGQPDVVVPWWSFTKTVLAAASLTLVRDGLIGLDDSVSEGPFTLRQLLRHQAGLADYSELEHYHTAVCGHETPWSADDMLQRLDAARLRYEPGTHWHYSNVGYLFVARLIQRITGLTLEQALTQRVFAPLGLTQVRLARTREDLKGVCLGSAPAYDPGWVYHGLLVGPLAQASLLLDHVLGGALLPVALLREMQIPLPLGGPIPGRPWNTPGYALGLMVGGVDRGLTLSGHTGAGPGSVLAVYRCVVGDNTATCAVFAESDDQGSAETHALEHLSAVLGSRQSIT
ncbi:serine hydrolase domain-containing protein [Pseudomonas taetrolens]|uniref:serine hydrolase domain-containing protein n=1 Tax=Pseudomonas taetrolens TaxID=47884 RepID=UPI0030DB2B7F